MWMQTLRKWSVVSDRHGTRLSLVITIMCGNQFSAKECLMSTKLQSISTDPTWLKLPTVTYKECRLPCCLSDCEARPRPSECDRTPVPFSTKYQFVFKRYCSLSLVYLVFKFVIKWLCICSVFLFRLHQFFECYTSLIWFLYNNRM